MSSISLRASALLTLAVLASGDLQAQATSSNVTVDPGLYSALQLRSVGPSRGGRSTAVTGYRDRMHTFLMGAAGGGIWRTELEPGCFGLVGVLGDADGCAAVTQ